MTSTTTPAGRAGTLALGTRTVNRLGFGAMRLTGPGIWGEPADRAECVRVVRRAVELGVDFLDTADAYGPFVSEQIIAEALHPYPEGVVVATKVGFTRQGPDRWTQVGLPAYLRQQVELSLRHLRVERIDLLQLHRIDPAVPVEDSVGELAAMVGEGKIDQLGLSEVGVDELERAAAVHPVVSVQNLYNLAERGSQPLLDHCTAHGIAFIPWRPLEGGRSPAQDSPLARVAAAHDATPSQVALAWALARSPMMLPIPGTSRVAHLEQNLVAAAIVLTPDELAALNGPPTP